MALINASPQNSTPEITFPQEGTPQVKKSRRKPRVEIPNAGLAPKQKARTDLEKSQRAAEKSERNKFNAAKSRVKKEWEADEKAKHMHWSAEYIADLKRAHEVKIEQFDRLLGHLGPKFRGNFEDTSDKDQELLGRGFVYIKDANSPWNTTAARTLATIIAENDQLMSGRSVTPSSLDDDLPVDTAEGSSTGLIHPSDGQVSIDIERPVYPHSTGPPIGLSLGGGLTVTGNHNTFVNSPFNELTDNSAATSYVPPWRAPHGMNTRAASSSAPPLPELPPNDHIEKWAMGIGPFAIDCPQTDSMAAYGAYTPRVDGTVFGAFDSGATFEAAGSHVNMMNPYYQAGHGQPVYDPSLMSGQLFLPAYN